MNTDQLPKGSTEEAPALDLVRLQRFASVPENTLANIALALETSEEKILTAISPKTWPAFQAQSVAVSETKRRAAINSAAESGDLRRVEFLLAATKKPDGCVRCQQAAALSTEELRVRIAKLQKVIDTPGLITKETWPNLNWV